MDIGPACTDRNNSTPQANTNVYADNPANENGTVTQIEAWAYNAVTNLETGSASLGTATVGRTGTISIAVGYNQQSADMDLSGGSCETFTSAGGDFTAYNADSGQYMAGYWDSGNMERDTASGVGWWNDSGDQITCSGNSFAWLATRAVPIYGTGPAAGGAAAPQVIRVIITQLWKLFPAAFLLAGVLNNPEVGRRESFNPMNWIRKKAT